MPEDPRSQEGPLRSSGRLAAMLVLLAGLAYSNAVFHPFLEDDIVLIVENPEIRSLSGLSDVIGFHPRWTRFVTHALEFAGVGLWPPLYHLDNILIHACIGLLVFVLVSRVSQDRLLGWWTAAIFLVHPINTEVVAQVSGRASLLAALFSLICLIVLERHVSRGGAWRLPVAVTALYLALFSKEMAVMTPLVFVAVHAYARVPAGARPERRFRFADLTAMFGEARLLYAGLAAGAIVLTACLVFLPGGFGIQGSPSTYDIVGPGLGTLDRVALAGLGLRLLLLPVGQTVDYTYDALGFASGTAWPLPGAFHVGLVIAAVVITLVGLARRHWVGLGGVWIALFQLPTAGIIRWHEVFAERFLYLPSIGIAVVMASVLVPRLRVASARRVALAAGVSILALFTTATLARNSAWSRPEELWARAVERYPGSARGHAVLAHHAMLAGRGDVAIVHYREALRILPSYGSARLGLAAALATEGRLEQALESVDEFLEDSPGDAKALGVRGLIHEALGDEDRALESFEAQVAADPASGQAYGNLARLHGRRGEVDDAVRLYEKALELDPGLAAALQDLARVCREHLGDEERAADYEERARAVLEAQAIPSGGS